MLSVTRRFLQRPNAAYLLPGCIVGLALVFALAITAFRLAIYPSPTLPNYWQNDAIVERLLRIEKQLDDPDTVPDYPALMGELTALYARRPLERRTVFLMAEVARRDGNPEEATKLEQIGGDMSLRERSLQARYVNRLAEKGDYAQAVLRLDALLRAFPDSSNDLMPALVVALARGNVQAAIAERLAHDPPWRRAFLTALYETLPEKSYYFNFFEQYILNQPTIDPADLSDYLYFLMDTGQVEKAQAAWETFNVARGRTVAPGLFDGNFSNPPDDIVLGWQMPANKMRRVSILTHSKDPTANGLRLDFNGRPVPDPLIQQIMTLKPGDYVFTGLARPMGLATERGFVWRIYCQEDLFTRQFMGASPPERAAHDWTQFTVPFTVPDTGCPSQVLRLEPLSTARLDTIATGPIMYRDFAISPRSPAGADTPR